MDFQMSELTIERLTCYAVIHFQIGFELPRWLILHTDVLTEFSFAIFSSFWNTEQTDDSYTHSVTSPCKKIILCRIWPGLAFSENRVALMSVGLIIVVKVGHDFALQIRVHGSVCPTRIIKCMCVCVLLHRRTFLDGARWASLIHSLQLQALIAPLQDLLVITSALNDWRNEPVDNYITYNVTITYRTNYLQCILQVLRSSSFRLIACAWNAIITEISDMAAFVNNALAIKQRYKSMIFM